MLNDLNPSVQGFSSIVRQDFDFFLSKNLPVINLFVDIVYRATGHSFACDKSLFPRLESLEFRQKRWVNVDNATGERL